MSQTINLIRFFIADIHERCRASCNFWQMTIPSCYA
jgi:hypothetical protein